GVVLVPILHTAKQSVPSMRHVIPAAKFSHGPVALRCAGDIGVTIGMIVKSELPITPSLGTDYTSTVNRSPNIHSVATVYFKQTIFNIPALDTGKRGVNAIVLESTDKAIGHKCLGKENDATVIGVNPNIRVFCNVGWDNRVCGCGIWVKTLALVGFQGRGYAEVVHL